MRPKSVEADVDQKVVLTCDVDGNPPADILWIHEPLDRVRKSLFIHSFIHSFLLASLKSFKTCE